MALSPTHTKAVSAAAVRAHVKALKKKKQASMVGRLHDLKKTGAFPSQKAK